MVRTGIATSEAIAQSLKEHNTPLSYGATPEAWKEALTTISGNDTTIEPREVDGVTGYQSTNETILKTLNSTVTTTDDDVEVITNESIKVNLYFTNNGSNVELDENPKLGEVVGTFVDDHYEFEIEPSDSLTLSYKYDGVDLDCTKSFITDTDDVIVIL